MTSPGVPRRRVLASLAAAIASPVLAKGLRSTGEAAPDMEPISSRGEQLPLSSPTLLSAPLPPGMDIHWKGVPRGDGTFIAPYVLAEDGTTKVFHLHCAPIEWETEFGKIKKGFAFNGTIPGPTIRVMENDRIRIVVQNDLGEPTVIHWHGMVLPFEMDGVHGVTQPDIKSGTSFTYEYTAVATGTHWYHPHMTGEQVGKGLYGSLEVVPLSGERAVHRDYRIFIGDTNLGLVLNGKTYPDTIPLPCKVGERVRIRMTSTGEMSHPIHLHGQPFDWVAQDGFPLAVAQTMDTHLISTAQTMDIETTILAPGRWVFHCHIFSHMHSPDGAMTGLVTFLFAADANGVVPGVRAPAPALPPPVPAEVKPPVEPPVEPPEGVAPPGGDAPPEGSAPPPEHQGH